MERTPQTPIEDEESYEAIESAVMETARGRWFLAEFALRNRQAETVTLLHSISRLERAIGRNAATDSRAPLGRLANDIELLVAAMMGDAGHPAEAQSKLQTAIAEGQKSCVEMAVIADAARDHSSELVAKLDGSDAFADLDLKLSELVRLSADQMASMRRFEALSEILQHVRTRIAEILQSSPSPLAAEAITPAPANDYLDITALSGLSTAGG